jgi:hypothetical protein
VVDSRPITSAQNDDQGSDCWGVKGGGASVKGGGFTLHDCYNGESELLPRIFPSTSWGVKGVKGLTSLIA